MNFAEFSPEMMQDAILYKLRQVGSVGNHDTIIMGKPIGIKNGLYQISFDIENNTNNQEEKKQADHTLH